MSRKLEDMDDNELRLFFHSFDHVILDCDGVIFLFFQLIEGADVSIETLKSIGKTIYVISNNTAYRRKRMIEIFKEKGIHLNPENYINPTRAIVEYLKNVNFRKKAHVIGMMGFREDLEESGLEITNPYQPEVFNGENLKHFCDRMVTDDPEIGAVIVCNDVNLNFFSLNKASKLLKRPDVLFITAGYSTRVNLGPKTSCLGSSYFHDMLIDISQRQPMALGKPKRDFQNYIAKLLPHDPKRVLFIGDGLQEDIEFAKQLGYQTLLVLTGISKESDLETCEERQRPDFYAESFGKLHEFINTINK